MVAPPICFGESSSSAVFLSSFSTGTFVISAFSSPVLFPLLYSLGSTGSWSVTLSAGLDSTGTLCCILFSAGRGGYTFGTAIPPPWDLDRTIGSFCDPLTIGDLPLDCWWRTSFIKRWSCGWASSLRIFAASWSSQGDIFELPNPRALPLYRKPLGLNSKSWARLSVGLPPRCMDASPFDCNPTSDDLRCGLFCFFMSDILFWVPIMSSNLLELILPCVRFFL